MDPQQISHIQPHVFLFAIQFYSKKCFQNIRYMSIWPELLVPATRMVETAPLFCPSQITGLYRLVPEIQY